MTRRSAALELPGGAADDGEDPEAVAASAGLVYETDTVPGLRRRRAGRGFTYLRPDGTRIDDPRVLARIKALAIPPAWKEVWISRRPNGHLQATGWDAKARKQYRYHPRWREVRDAAKFERLADFGAALPLLRARVRADLGLRGLPEEKVVATVVALLDRTLIRVGNECYARENDSYGLTTLRRHHAEVAGATVRFRFRGKSGRTAEQQVSDRRLARIIRSCQELPGQVLFTYLDDDGVSRPVGSREVNEYLQDKVGPGVSAKDFRTWGATSRVAGLLHRAPVPESEAEARRAVVAAIKETAVELGNTPAVCRASYVHPAVLDAYPDALLAVSEREVNRVLATSSELARDEALLLAVLSQATAASAPVTPVDATAALRETS